MTQRDSLPGQKLDDYTLETLLGRGGMASVYRGWDTRARRYVAIKVIDKAYRNEADYVARFEREAQAIGQLEHQNVVRLYRFGEADGLLYMAMQYVEGSDLATELEQYHRTGETMPLEDVRRIIRQVGLALDYVHSRGVIHRDIKPSNIMLTKEGNAVLTDFGLALMTQDGTRGEIFGSPHYISPEQAISSAGAVPQSDLYSVGVILYEIFTGVVPFDADSALDIAMKHMTEPPRPPREIKPDISPELERLILKALAKEPGERFQNGLGLANALDNALRGGGGLSRRIAPVTLAERVALQVEKNPLPPIPAIVAATPPLPIAPPPTEVAPTQPAPAPKDVGTATAPSFNTAKPTNPTIPVPAAAPEPVPTPTLKTPQPASSGGRGLWVYGAAAVIGLLVLLGLFLALSGDGDENEEGNDQPEAVVENSPTFLPTEPPASPTVELTSTPLPPTPTPMSLATDVPAVIPSATVAPTLTSVPTEAPTTAPATTYTYALMLIKNGKRSLGIYNLTQASIPPLSLAPLRLVNERGEISGSQLNVTTLSNGQCIALMREMDDEIPGSICKQETIIAQIEVPEAFWDKEFTIYYNGGAVTTCDESQCAVTFTVTAP